MTLHTGDCIEVMAGMQAESVDAIVTDPPYGLEFMGKEWDRLQGGKLDALIDRHPDPTGKSVSPYYRPGWGNSEHRASVSESQAWHEAWAREAFRVAKPGAHLIAAGGTRTYHRLACAIEDAGWEIRDCLVWAYASGFPKSKNLPGGLGTALKPAWEPWVMARKPLRGTVAANVTQYGTGALNIGATRIGTDGGHAGAGPGPSLGILGDGLNGTRAEPVSGMGRWPANLILTDPIFDGDVEGVVGGGTTPRDMPHRKITAGSVRFAGAALSNGHHPPEPEDRIGGYGDSGTYSRFFLIAKSSRADREPVVRGQLPASAGRTEAEFGGADGTFAQGRNPVTGERTGNVISARENAHPTVKPVELMRHLVRLVCPPGGTVLDCFAGSGSTLLAAEMEGFAWIGIEQSAEYVAIAEARLHGTQRGLGLDVGAPTRKRSGKETPTERPPSRHKGWSGGWSWDDTKPEDAA